MPPASGGVMAGSPSIALTAARARTSSRSAATTVRPLRCARDAFARLEIGLLPLTTPLESPQSKGMAEMHAALDVERMAASCPGGSSLRAAHSVDPQSSWLHVSAVVDDP